DLNPFHLLNHAGWNFFAVVEICKLFDPILGEEKPARTNTAMGQRQWSDFEIPKAEWVSDQSWVRHEITFGPRSAVKSIGKYTAKILHGVLSRIDRESASSQIAESAAIIQAHDVVGVRMGEQDGIEPANILTEHLSAKIRRSINNQPNLVRGNIDR